MASPKREFLYRLLFKLKLHESHGEAFQRLFELLMKHADPRFRQIAPWGNWGDGGNDGWIEEDAHYFQVYGPRSTTAQKETHATAVSKVGEAFEKLKEKWGGVRRFTFVMNDRFEGVPAPLDRSLVDLKTRWNLEADVRSGSLASVR